MSARELFSTSSVLNNLGTWRLFLRVCELGSLSKTAASTGLDVSTISRRLDRLEAETGFSLLKRGTRSVSATPEGELLRRRIELLLEDFDEAIGTCRSPSDELVVLSGPPCFSDFLLSRWALEFSRLYPNVRFSLELTDLAVDPDREGVDIAIHSGAAAALAPGVLRLGSLTSRVCAAPSYIAAHGAPRDPESLERHVLLGYRGRMNGRDIWFEREGRLERHRYRETLTATSTTALLGCVREGLGILLYACDFMTQDAYEQGELLELLPEWRQPPTIVHAVVSATGARRPVVDAFLDFMRKRWRETHGLLA